MHSIYKMTKHCQAERLALPLSTRVLVEFKLIVSPKSEKETFLAIARGSISTLSQRKSSPFSVMSSHAFSSCSNNTCLSAKQSRGRFPRSMWHGAKSSEGSAPPIFAVQIFFSLALDMGTFTASATRKGGVGGAENEALLKCMATGVTILQ